MKPPSRAAVAARSTAATEVAEVARELIDAEGNAPRCSKEQKLEEKGATVAAVVCEGAVECAVSSSSLLRLAQLDGCGRLRRCRLGSVPGRKVAWQYPRCRRRRCCASAASCALELAAAARDHTPLGASDAAADQRTRRERPRASQWTRGADDRHWEQTCAVCVSAAPPRVAQWTSAEARLRSLSLSLCRLSPFVCLVAMSTVIANSGVASTWSERFSV